MKIALIGAQGTGKTTVLNELRKVKALEDYNYTTEVVRDYHKNFNIPISQKSSEEGQLIYFNKYLENLLLLDNFISDRSLIDVMAYTLYIKDNVAKTVTDYMFNVLERYVSKYDYLFYFPIMFPIVKDDVRTDDKRYQNKIDLIMNSVMSFAEGKSNIVIHHIEDLKVEDRISFILNKIGVK